MSSLSFWTGTVSLEISSGLAASVCSERSSNAAIILLTNVSPPLFHTCVIIPHIAGWCKAGSASHNTPVGSNQNDDPKPWPHVCCFSSDIFGRGTIMAAIARAMKPQRVLNELPSMKSTRPHSALPSDRASATITAVAYLRTADSMCSQGMWSNDKSVRWTFPGRSITVQSSRSCRISLRSMLRMRGSCICVSRFLERTVCAYSMTPRCASR